MTTDDLLRIANKTIRYECSYLDKLSESLDKQFGYMIDEMMRCQGNIIFIGVGKSGFIAEKIASSLRSVGMKSIYINPIDALHGSIGIIKEDDMVIFISKSGESNELKPIVDYINNNMGKITTVSITNKPMNYLTDNTDIHIFLEIESENRFFDNIPTTSCTALMSLGNAIIICIIHLVCFEKERFHKYHPAGSIGNDLKKVSDIMQNDCLPFVNEGDDIFDVLRMFISGRNRGVAIVIDNERCLKGIIVDGDLKRIILKNKDDFMNLKVQDIKVDYPFTIDKNSYVEEALELMKEKSITALPVIDLKNHVPNRVVGLLHIHDILNNQEI